jgi:hypothetical protein
VPDNLTSDQIRYESNELREDALRFRVQAASLIERAEELEKRIAQIERYYKKRGEAA